MTTIDEIARTIAEQHGIESISAVRDGVTALVDQISDDADLWDAEANALTPDGVIVITEAYDPQLVSTRAGQLLVDIETEARAIVAAEQVIAERTAERDRLIRAAMQTELPRADIAAAAGVKEARLYQIRDGRR